LSVIVDRHESGNDEHLRIAPNLRPAVMTDESVVLFLNQIEKFEILAL
jgi:hypothetical protein